MKNKYRDQDDAHRARLRPERDPKDDRRNSPYGGSWAAGFEHDVKMRNIDRDARNAAKGPGRWGK